jgi:amino acid permease
MTEIGAVLMLLFAFFFITLVLYTILDTYNRVKNIENILTEKKKKERR